ncbi:UTP--glucose-1-phosphate uridylyltransferase [Cytobacillus eiseniae]|uniref:UTP--glucose-1-phosphate uridylyltransferase n=1 Tax=Cytobacillus eiseniae TaxID=762947 RepID=A0ABS4RHN4_9BACI|nr:UTP--glucose-1-phosphate uridylyltransferase [Cytobacillus eiseniae]
MKIRKAIIPAAGLGTRFLPATKAQPKEMLPIVDKPAIQYIVEEAIESGIEDIIIVTGRGKRAIEDHFDKSYELEETLLKKNKQELLENVRKISNLANIHYIRQKEARGLGDAIFCASRFIGNEPFAVLLGDDIVRSPEPCLKQLIKVFERYSTSVVGVQEVDKEEVSKYGIIEPKNSSVDKIISVKKLIEKPSIKDAPSRYAILGRYILKPEIFDILADLPPGAGDEIQLTDAINQLNEKQEVIAYDFEGKRYDLGDKLGFVKATIDFALERADMRKDVLSYLDRIVEGQKILK